jgi:hypothetical protein
VLRVEVIDGGFNINWIQFATREESTPTPTPTPTETDTPTTTEVPDDYGVQGYGERGYGGVEA